MNDILINILAPAEQELADTFEYYENQSRGLGKEFIHAFRLVLDRINNFPFAWPIVQDNIRKCRFGKFPYDAIYALETNEITIVAISHHYREPYYWADRLA